MVTEGCAAYISCYLGPQSVHGADRNPQAIRFCRKRHRIHWLSFSRGDAMALDLADGTSDAVVNIEASHCYPDVQRFFGEVYRVLRSGGRCLYADFRRNNDERALLDRQLKQSGLDLVSWDDISTNVVRGMRLNSEKYLKLADRSGLPLCGLDHNPAALPQLPTSIGGYDFRPRCSGD